MVRVPYDYGQVRGNIMFSFNCLEEDLVIPDLCLNNLVTELPWSMLCAGRLNPFMTGMEIKSASDNWVIK